MISKNILRYLSWLHYNSLPNMSTVFCVIRTKIVVTFSVLVPATLRPASNA